MAIGYLDTCMFTPTLGGTTDWTLSAAVQGYKTLAGAGAVNGVVYYYRAESADKSEWEEGSGAYTSAGSILARTTITTSSNSNAKVTFSAAPTVFVVASVAALRDAASLFNTGVIPIARIPVGTSAGTVAEGDDSRFSNPTTIASINGGQLAGFRNLLINADGRFNQRAPATNADNTYGHDRWLALTQTDTIAVSTVSDAENGTPRMWRLTQSQATAQRMGYCQWIEGANCKHLRGKTVTLSGRIKFSLNAAVRYAICERTGTEDTPSTARDIVNDWTSGTYTAGNFFKSTTFNVLAVGSITPAAATFSDLTVLSATVGSSANNLVILIWTEGTAAQNATLDGALQLEQGSVATAREFRFYSIEQSLCYRYYYRVTALATGDRVATGYMNTTTQAIFQITGRPMRINPAVAYSNLTIAHPGGTATVSALGTTSLIGDVLSLPLTTTGLTAGQPGQLRLPGAGEYIELDAEI